MTLGCLKHQWEFTLVPSHGSVLFCLHDTITKCHASTSHSGVSSPWLLYWSKNITLWYKILQWYHVNAK